MPSRSIRSAAPSCLLLLAIYVGAAFALFAWRGTRLREGAPFELVSRESGLVANNLLLSVILGTVFVGTLYPAVRRGVDGRENVGRRALFQSVAGPLALILAVLVGVGPLLSWRRERRPVLKRLVVAGAACRRRARWPSASSSRRPSACFRGWASPSPRFLAPASILPLVGRNPLRAPLATWGMVIAHFGVAVALAGMAANDAFTRETLTLATQGRDGARRSVDRPVRRCRPDRGQQFQRDRGGVDRHPRRRGRSRSSRRPVTSPARRPKPTKRRSRPSGTGNSTRSSASRTRRAAGSCACGGSRS